MKILLLEDDFILNELISNFLSKFYEIKIAYNSTDALKLIDDEKFDIFIFDINLPDISGLDLLKELRECSNQTPTIFISAYHDMQSLQTAFKNGASDYIKKPFDLEELKLRLSHIITTNNLDSLVKIEDNIVLNKQRSILSIDGIEKAISKKENEILIFLISKRKQVVSFEEIYANVWECDIPSSDTTLRTYIKNIRKLIGKDAIKTIYKYGYVLE
jgi:two-component system OmpR family response regulator